MAITVFHAQVLMLPAAVLLAVALNARQALTKRATLTPAVHALVDRLGAGGQPAACTAALVASAMVVTAQLALAQS
jgi:hypothetical protein